MNFLQTTATVGFFVAAAAIGCGNASAAPLSVSANRDVSSHVAADSTSDLLPVQYRRNYGGRYSGRGGDGAGAAVAAGILGLIIAGVIAQEAQRQQRYQDQHAYCAQRFRSYDPQSGTFMGYDGVRHPCP